MKININGKSFSSIKDYAEALKNDPNSECMVWDIQNAESINGNRVVNGTGKCTYKGKVYEGKIEYDEDGHVYVGGELVK